MSKRDQFQAVASHASRLASIHGRRDLFGPQAVTDAEESEAKKDLTTAYDAAMGDAASTMKNMIRMASK